MKRILPLVFFCLAVFQTALAQIISSRITNLTQNHNVYEGDKKGMKVCADITTIGKGPVMLVAYFYNETGQPLQGSGKYTSSAGELSTSNTHISLLPSSKYTIEAFIPYNVFPQAPGKHSLKCKVYLYDVNAKRFLNNSSFLESDFSLTNPDRSSNNVNNKTRWYDAPPEMNGWYFKTTDGRIMTRFHLTRSAVMDRTMYTLTCYPGPSLLNICWNYNLHQDYFEFIDGYCWVRIARDLSWIETHPGFRYTQWATKDEYDKYEKQWGQLNKTVPPPPISSPNNGSTNNRNNSGSNLNPPHKVGCSRCNYTGVNPQPCSAPCTTWIAPYTNNSAGNRCTICNNGTNHHHDRCAHCNVPNW